jgi:hypothetical protein
VVDELGNAGDFDTARQTVRFHYQWMIVHDFPPQGGRQKSG